MSSRAQWMLALTLGIAGGCSSDPEATPAATEDTTTADSAGQDSTDAADATDGTDASDSVDSTDGADATDAVDAPDTSDGSDAADADVVDEDTLVEPTTPEFRFAIDPSQPISSAPFPNDLYRGADGLITLAALGDDPVVGGLASPATLANLTGHANGRKGFGSVSPVWFFTHGTPDLASLKNRVQILVLGGPEAGRTVTPRIVWSASASAVGVMADWGDYLMPESTYAIIIQKGVTNQSAVEFVPGPELARALAPTDPGGEGDSTRVRDAFKPLRDHLATVDESYGELVAASVFTTEPVLDVARAVLKGVDGATLAAPSDIVRYDPTLAEFQKGGLVAEADLKGYFGVPTAPYLTNPGVWEDNRDTAKDLTGTRYEGGTYHAGFGAVVNGSVTMPSFNFEIVDGQPVNVALSITGDAAKIRLDTVVPFTLFLCKSHIADPAKIPVAIFQHGGGRFRVDGLPFANANCTVGVATIAFDMAFHGTRRTFEVKDGVIVPTEVDALNSFTGLAKGDVGYVADQMADPASAASSVAGTFALTYDIDPLIVEANLLTIVAENYMALRYLKEGDWAGLVPGLSFDAGSIFHESLSFGTSFTTALIALVDDFRGVVGSVGSSYVLHGNLPMAPSNAFQAAGIVNVVLGLKTPAKDLQSDSHQDVVVSILGWLAERGDSHPYAPYILRHRPTAKLPPLLHSGDSWDETLHGPSQVTFASALGLPTYTSGSEWKIASDMPGADAVTSAPYPGTPIESNTTFDGNAVTAGLFWFGKSCHAQVLTTLCAQNFVHPYPPVEKLDDSIPYASPICGLHGQVHDFLESLLAGGPGVITAPTHTCDQVYGK